MGIITSKGLHSATSGLLRKHRIGQKLHSCIFDNGNACDPEITELSQKRVEYWCSGRIHEAWFDVSGGTGTWHTHLGGASSAATSAPAAAQVLGVDRRCRHPERCQLI